MTRRIGTLAEKSMHAALKAYCARPGDALEHGLGGYVIDIVRGLPDAPSCIEIQTGSLAKIKPKLVALLDSYPVRVVYPIAQERRIVRVDADGVILSRRRSPRRALLRPLPSPLLGNGPLPSPAPATDAAWRPHRRAATA